MDKKKVTISLRTDSENEIITQALRNFTCLNTTEIVKNLKKPKKVPFKDKLFRRHTICEARPIDFNQFDSISINADSPNASMNIQCLIDENYSFYIDKLRTLYPYFKFNHYSKYFEQIRLKKKDQQQLNEFEYNFDNKKANLNIDEAFLFKSEEYKIESTILEHKKDELQLAGKMLDSKIEGIELELGKVLKNSAIVENYIDNNLHFKIEIENVLTNLIQKQKTKESFKRHYLGNSSRLMLAMAVKRNKVNLLNVIKQLHDVIRLINKMKDNNNMTTTTVTVSNNNNNDDDDNNELSNIRTRINSLRKNNNLKLMNCIERELQKYNDQSEIKHTEEFIQIMTSAIHQCFMLNSVLESSANQDNSSQDKYNLDSIQQHKKNYIDDSKPISFYFLILLPSKSKILNQLLSVFSIVITENYEIPIIIEKLKERFINEIVMLHDNLKQVLSNIRLITTLSKAYFILIENYTYLLELFNNNFAFSPKNFSDLTKCIKNETKSRLFPLVNTMIIEIIANGDVEQLLFTKEKVKEMISEFLSNMNISLDEYYSQYENDFIFQFVQIQIEKIKDCVSKEKWIQVQKIGSHYQKLIDHLLIDFHEISKEELYSSFTSTSAEDSSYLQIKGFKIIPMESTLIVLQFLFDTYKILFYLHHKYSQTIILQLCKWITYYLNHTQVTIINSQGEVNSKKITEKEIMLVNATIVLLKHVFFSFITYFIGDNDNAINETINSVLKKVNEIHQSCVESMNDVSTQVINETLKEFNSLNFKEYPTFTEKNYNVYIIRYGKLKKIYDSMLLSFETQDIIALYNRVFSELLEQMNKAVSSKPKIENDAMLKQYIYSILVINLFRFRSEMFYMKKLLETYELINSKEYANKIDDISLLANPNKKPKKKKKDKGKGKLQEKEKTNEKEKE